jgi:pantetheine-phosphate adenylyltransferase
MFSLDERSEMLREATAQYGNVTVDSFDGLIVDFCKDHSIQVIVKGLRAISDFDYELQMAQMNHGLAGIETLFMTTNPLYSFLSSSLVKEVATYGGDVSGLVPEAAGRRLLAHLGKPKN